MCEQGFDEYREVVIGDDVWIGRRAIIMPGVKASFTTALCVISAALLSSAFYFIPLLKEMSTAAVIIVSAVAVSVVFALVAPIDDPDPWKEEEGGEDV